MKAKKIWIAQHPDEPDNCEITVSDPRESHVYIHTGLHTGEDRYVEWKEYIAFEIES